MLQRRLITFCSPFLLLLFYIRDFRTLKKDIVWVYFIFGVFFIIPSVSHDSFRYLERFESISQLTLAEFYLEYIGSFWTKQIDFVVPLIFFTLGKIGVNRFLFFPCLGIIIGLSVSYFVNNVIRFNDISRVNRSVGLLLVGVLILVPVYTVNHFRWYLALVLFVSSLTLVDLRRVLVVQFMSVFVHFSFVILMPLYLIARYARIPQKYLVIVLILSYTVKLDSVALNSLSSVGFSSEYIEQKRVGYSSSNYVKELDNAQDNRRWIIRYRQLLTSLGISSVILLLIKDYRRFNFHTHSFLSMLLLVLILANLLNGHFVLYNRLSHIGFLIFLGLISGLKTDMKNYRIVFLISLGLLFIEGTYVFRVGLDYFDERLVLPLSSLGYY